jgi:hypothetical protein
MNDTIDARLINLIARLKHALNLIESWWKTLCSLSKAAALSLGNSPSKNSMKRPRLFPDSRKKIRIRQNSMRFAS